MKLTNEETRIAKKFGYWLLAIIVLFILVIIN